MIEACVVIAVTLGAFLLRLNLRYLKKGGDHASP